MILLLALLAAPMANAACNCVAYSVEALRSLHFRLKTLPNIAENDWCKHAGCYAASVLYIKNIDDCHTMLHEFVHHMQWLHGGDARDATENYRREMQAAFITNLAELEYGRCE